MRTGHPSQLARLVTATPWSAALFGLLLVACSTRTKGEGFDIELPGADSQRAVGDADAGAPGDTDEIDKADPCVEDPDTAGCIPCGGATCAEGDMCCGDSPGPSLTCREPGACTGNESLVSVACDGNEDCGSEANCCVSISFYSGAEIALFRAKCDDAADGCVVRNTSASLFGGHQAPACQTKADCAGVEEESWDWDEPSTPTELCCRFTALEAGVCTSADVAFALTATGQAVCE